MSPFLWEEGQVMQGVGTSALAPGQNVSEHAKFALELSFDWTKFPAVSFARADAAQSLGFKVEFLHVGVAPTFVGD